MCKKCNWKQFKEQNITWLHYTNVFKCLWERVTIIQFRGAVSGGSSGSMEPLDFLKWPYGTTQFLKMVLEIIQFLRKKSCFW